MLQLRLAPACKVLGAAVRGKASGIPKSDWCLHAELVLESSQRRSGVVGPVTPGASGQAILCMVYTTVTYSHTNDLNDNII